MKHTTSIDILDSTVIATVDRQRTASIIDHYDSKPHINIDTILFADGTSTVPDPLITVENHDALLTGLNIHEAELFLTELLVAIDTARRVRDFVITFPHTSPTIQTPNSHERQ